MCNAYGYLANDVFIIITPVGGGTAELVSALQQCLTEGHGVVMTDQPFISVS